MEAMHVELPAVRVAVNDRGVVVGVAVAGRPGPRPFKSGAYEGSHLTPWAVFCDTVRRAAVGHSVGGAAREVRHLLEQLDTADGAVVKLLPKQRGIWFDEMIDKGWDKLQAAEEQEDVAKLQEGIAMYLTGRNLAPVSAVFLGEDRARGRGEAAALHQLRAFEEGSTWLDDEKLRELMAGLLDEEALGFLGTVTKSDSDKAPGVQLGIGADPVRTAILEHLKELSLAYPLAYEASGLGEEKGFKEYFGKKVVVTKGFKLPKASDDWDDAAAGWSTTSTNLCVANIRLKPDEKTVRDVTIEGRGNTLLNTQGHHVTAHAVIEAVVSRRVNGWTVEEALGRMLDLSGKLLRELATYPDVERLPRRLDPKGVYAKAFAGLEAARAEATRAQNAHEPARGMVPPLEGLIAAYTVMRNALPMAAVLRGAPANAKAEGRALTLLRQWDADRENAPAGKVLWTMWRLLDMDAVSSLWSDSDRLHEWAPGAPDRRAERVRRVLSVHIATMERAFFELAQAAGLDSVVSVKWVLEQRGIKMPQSFIADMNLNRQKEVRPVVAFRSGRRNDDEEEWNPKRKRSRK